MKFLAFTCCLIINTALCCEVSVRYESYVSPNQMRIPLEYHGLDVDFARALLEVAECRANFVSLPWARAIEMMKLGKLDMMTSISDRPERHFFMSFIGPQRQETIVFAMDKDNLIELYSVEDLATTPRPVAVHTGAYYGDAFSELLQKKENQRQFITVVDNSHKIAMLKQGRISGFLEEKYNLAYQMMHNEEFAHIVINPFIVNTEPVYFAISKHSPKTELVERLQIAFESKEYQIKRQAILKKYQLD